MSHPEQIEFVSIIKKHLPEYFNNSRVLEIGSLDINGSIRNLFRNCEYVGIDVSEGPGVDIAKPAQLLDFQSESFDCIVSCECLEHNPFWVETMANMFRMTKPGGLVIMSCAAVGRLEHGTARMDKDSSPLTVELGWNYYRNVSKADIERSFNLDWWFDDYIINTNYYSIDTYFVALKNPEDDIKINFNNLRINLRDYCRPTNSIRSFLVFLASTFGEPGVGLLRSVAQIFGVGSKDHYNN